MTSELISKVIENDLCIGCGVCTAVDSSPTKIELGVNGQYKAVLNEGVLNPSLAKSLDSVCPFSDQSLNEDDLSKAFIEIQDSSYNSKIGFFNNLYAGYVKESNF